MFKNFLITRKKKGINNSIFLIKNIFKYTYFFLRFLILKKKYISKICNKNFYNFLKKKKNYEYNIMCIHKLKNIKKLNFNKKYIFKHNFKFLKVFNFIQLSNINFFFNLIKIINFYKEMFVFFCFNLKSLSYFSFFQYFSGMINYFRVKQLLQKENSLISYKLKKQNKFFINKNFVKPIVYYLINIKTNKINILRKKKNIYKKIPGISNYRLLKYYTLLRIYLKKELLVKKRIKKRKICNSFLKI